MRSGRSGILRAQFETALGKRVPPFTDIERRVRETASTGIGALDTSIGGLIRGTIIEIFGSGASGKTSMMLSVLASASRREEACALIDGKDGFSPESGAAAGVHADKFLWVRCQNLTQALKATDLILQGGGFGVVALDVSDLPADKLQAVPLSTWFRFQRSIEKTPTILALISQNGVAQTCASLALRAVSDFEFEDRLLTQSTTMAEIVRIRSSPKSKNVRFNFYPSFSNSIAHPQ